MDLVDPVTTLPGIGGTTATKLAVLGISTVFDLLYHLPFRYEDRSIVTPSNKIQVGDTITITGILSSVKNITTKSGRRMQVATLTDDFGKINVAWFNQVYLARTFANPVEITLYGKVEFFGSKPTLFSPQYEMGRSVGIVPIYHETAGLTSKFLRLKIRHVLDQLKFDDFLPADINLPIWRQCLEQIHFPDKLETVNEVKKRLALDELLLLQLRTLVHRNQWRKTRLAHKLAINIAEIESFIAKLPFKLTPSQHQVVQEIMSDLARDTPMNRLLEGDVGSGKTVVAAIAAYVAHMNKFTTLVMAPTQILAAQHYETFRKFLTPLGMSVGLATGQTKNFDTQSNVVVGTQALISEGFTLPQVGLVVIDEQHRFGVAQRGMAADKGISPHVLAMTATPIPRTIALTLYGDLDLSVLTDLPTGRLPVKTWLVPETKRANAYTWIKAQLKTGAQVFVVCPFIEESESQKTIKAAAVEFDHLKKLFPEYSLGLLHGKLKSTEKNQVLDEFRAGKTQILVATPVVEVGIDIPNASVIVIEAAHRFGLAQLHQLRGRVGRSSAQAYCLLFADSQTTRLKAMEQHHSGPILAEIDLKLRGPGELYGEAQHGLSGLKVATYTDLELISQAKSLAEAVLPRLPDLPLLRSLVEKDKIGQVQTN